jgi:DNA-binding ferritin-like protein
MNSNSSLSEKTFDFLICMMGCRDQLRMNHWQTKSYAEHKMTDDLMGDLSEYIDELGEAALGEFGRPTITSTHNMITDMGITSTKSVLEKLCSGTRELIAEYKITEIEGILAILGELDADLKKYKFLSTLE